MGKNKFFIVSFVAVALLMFIFVAAQIPGAHQSPSDLPVAIVNEDNGDMSATIVDTIQEQSTQKSGGEAQTIEWQAFDNKQEMMAALDNQEVYGALLIPENYSNQFASLQSENPASPVIEAFISEGSNTMVANILNQAFNGMLGQMNGMISEQMLGQVEEAGAPLSAEQARLFTKPVQMEITQLHETGEMGNAPLSLFQPIWIGSLAGAVLLFLAGKDRVFSTVKSKFKFRLTQVIIAVIIGFIAGFSLPWFTTFMLGYEYENFITLALFLSITSMSFILMILATMTWIGFGGIVIFVLLLFFGLPILQMAPEMLPEFYRDWIYPWLPMRFMLEGVRDILFFNESVWNSSTTVLAWIFSIGAILQLSKVWLRKNSDSQNGSTS
ncbi:ABC transporter permease [Salinicoccus roseus]|uniref:YhgE/Pip domain-containing protein n=1 Tax=Salinicoccus roseus TaxID=45670 RepID=UPI000F4FE1FF|nr:ABC transporter permease [Salinicoccus roseus]RPE51141.1 uncharacterized protein DUF3533 [Salinicoccus roseus]GGA77657.1 phage infection protein [Salinicoccus roseus]